MKVFFKSIALVLLTHAFMVTLNAQELYEQTFKFGKVLEWIDQYYVDSVNKDQLVDHAIIQLLKELDPHSSYLSPQEVDKLTEPLQGNFEGIGISFHILEDTVYIISPIPDGPSEKAGVRPGDRIIKVNGMNVAGVNITTDKVYSLLRGDRGTKVLLSVLRRNTPSCMDFEVVRDKIPIRSVDASYMVDDRIGYIRLTRFSMTTVEEFTKAIEVLKTQRVKDLILDLTGNGGGYLEVAVNVADQFLDKNRLILFTQGSHSPRKEYYATKKGCFESGNLIILIDEGSASASEILSGAIQDWDRGILIGRRSYGKGLVQKPLSLPDKSMIRLTVARYYTPTGRLIQKPYQMDREAYNQELSARFKHGEFIHKDSIRFADSLQYFTLRNSRLVYGGGGIMPDYFVSMDTSYQSALYRQVVQKGIIPQYALEYIDQHRPELTTRFPDFDTYLSAFSFTEELMPDLLQYIRESDIAIHDEDLLISGSQISSLLRANIARYLWSENEFFQISNERDPKFETAVNILRNWDKYEAMLLKEK
jgi:carboxyl-terminal processing protease